MTQGSGSSYVTAYTLQYSMDDEVYVQMFDDFNSEITFKGNFDASSQFSNQLPYGLLVQYLRIQPQSYENGLAMQVDVYGCVVEGKVLSNNVV